MCNISSKKVNASYRALPCLQIVANAISAQLSLPSCLLADTCGTFSYCMPFLPYLPLNNWKSCRGLYIFHLLFPSSLAPSSAHRFQLIDCERRVALNSMRSTFLFTVSSSKRFVHLPSSSSSISTVCLSVLSEHR